MVLAWLTFLTGIAISVVAIYYSVLGLAAIFAAAVIPIVIMGTTLEAAKLVTAWWLKANWHRAPLSIKIYLLPAVIMLMIITSMGIFGFLSKAHTDQAVPLGDTASQVAFIDEKINNERETIANARSLIKQLDDAVLGIQSGQGRELRNSDGTTRIENPAERALQIRRAQARDRAALTQTIEEAQARIVKLQEEKAPIAGKLRAVEAEVGPIKYIAKLIYGDNPDQNILERAVVWVIIIIVMVFDPLAVLLLLASQMSFQWARQEKKEREDELVQEDTEKERNREETSTAPQPNVGSTYEGDREEQPESNSTPDDVDLSEEANRKIAEIEPEINLEPFEEIEHKSSSSPLDEWNEMIAEAERALKEENKVDEHKIEKTAKTLWKEKHGHETTIKRERDLYEKGLIDKLPWKDIEEQLKAKADNVTEDEAARQALEWAQEQLESKKGETYVVKENNQQIVKTKDGYIQNSEQGEQTIWQKIQEKKTKDE
jgi:hypothetical protein